jgi:hypothetical protein
MLMTLDALPSRPRAVLGALLLALLAASAIPRTVANAAPVRADRSDNTFYFTYDAEQGRITQESSSLQERRRDPVSYRIYVREVDGAATGERLKASVSLKLNRSAAEKKAYRGSLKISIHSSGPAPAYEAEREVSFVLRKRDGARSQSFTFYFDLPSGDYSASSAFRSN